MEAALETATDPIEAFAAWLGDAEESEPVDPNAMALATVDADGMPDVRMVLLKSYGPDGFVFYTNRDSTKGEELAANPRAALCFHWKSLGRQLRIRGTISEVSDEEADAYFRSRPKGSRIGAWASQQSRPIESRFALERAVAKYAAKFGLRDVPRPPYWVGYRLAPQMVEFWQSQKYRLHDRIVFTLEPDGSWTRQRLYP
jgi:pyridoxamine 5'-phosphate oxidase